MVYGQSTMVHLPPIMEIRFAFGYLGVVSLYCQPAVLGRLDVRLTASVFMRFEGIEAGARYLPETY